MTDHHGEPQPAALATPVERRTADGTKGKAAGKARRSRRRARRRAAETAAYTGLGLITLAQPWALLLIVPALLLALRD
ncbi:hypothetical protein OG871_33875 [Kitasatospora sp. NBC_00374]|uniref:hypothetical protein n=1 Tax=Kitasatospora sp. NBC_00374 TaxID=2975964 RepID=UPI0030E5519D